MRRMVLAGLAAWFCAVFVGPLAAFALELNTGVNFDYNYAQDDFGGEVSANTKFNQKYEIKYATSLTSAFDFLGAVRLDLQDSWSTSQASASRVAPALEMATKGSQLAAKIAYDVIITSADAYQETADKTSYSSNLSFGLEMTPELWPEMTFKYQRQRTFEENTAENTTSSFEFSTRKDIYGVRLEYNLKLGGTDNALPSRSSSTGTAWAAKATYKEVLWGDTEFEIAYDIKEEYEDALDRGVFSGETASYTQNLRTRFKNSLVIGPRMMLGLAWEYQFGQDLLALDFDYKVQNKYVLDLRWDALDELKITGEARRETDFTAEVDGVEDGRTQTDGFKTGFDLTSISWLRLSGKAELKNVGKVDVETGGSVEKTEDEKYELIAKNRIGEFWDLTVDAITSNKHLNDVLTNRETRVKAGLKLNLLDLVVTPSYEVSRTNDWERDFDYPTSQRQARESRIKFEYQLQLLEMFKSTFSHEYIFKVEDTLDAALNFERVLQFSEDTRFTVTLAQIVRDVRVEGEIARKASDTADDPDPEIIELSYKLKLDWKTEQLSLLSSISYNDKGDSFDDLSFNVKASWKSQRLEMTGEYQFDKVIKDITEPKDEKRKLNLKLSYRF